MGVLLYTKSTLSVYLDPRHTTSAKLRDTQGSVSRHMVAPILTTFIVNIVALPLLRRKNVFQTAVTVTRRLRVFYAVFLRLVLGPLFAVLDLACLSCSAMRSLMH